LSRAYGSQRSDAVRYSLSLIQGNWWSRLGPKTYLEWAAQMLANWGRIWHAATLKERKDMTHALLRRVTVDKNEDSPELQIGPRLNSDGYSA
jgi:hypothetical protein